jgi:hypothetical protein
MSDSDSLRRRSTRVPWAGYATLETREGAECTGQIADISLNGLWVQCVPEGLAEGDPITVHVPLGDTAEVEAVEAAGHVVRKAEAGVGVNFDAMDLDSVTELRQVVTYNSPDPLAAEREASHLRLYDPRHPPEESEG